MKIKVGAVTTEYEGVARIPEPREGQKVVLVLRKRDATATSYGVVLEVNGAVEIRAHYGLAGDVFSAAIGGLQRVALVAMS